MKTEMMVQSGRHTAVTVALWCCSALATSVGAQERADVLKLSLTDESWGAPTVAATRGGVTTLTFLDEGGRPVEISDIVGPADDWLLYQRATSHGHVATLRAVQRKTGNIVVFLEGVDRPAHFEVVVDDEPATAQVEVRVEGTQVVSGGRNETGANVPRGGELDAAIREYLLNNPDVLREALDPTRQIASVAQRMRGEILDAPGVHVAGSDSAPITVIEFFDYRCGFCKRSLDAVRVALEREDVRLQLREYPILGEDSTRAARAALAAGQQGQYLDAHLALMAHEGEYDEASIKRIAEDLGLDVPRMLEDMQSAEVSALIDANHALARELGVSGTPAFLVAGAGDVRVSPGALDAARMNALVDAAGE